MPVEVFSWPIKKLFIKPHEQHHDQLLGEPSHFYHFWLRSGNFHKTPIMHLLAGEHRNRRGFFGWFSAPSTRRPCKGSWTNGTFLPYDNTIFPPAYKENPQENINRKSSLRSQQGRDDQTACSALRDALKKKRKKENAMPYLFQSIFVERKRISF